ncbi:hypothetical protein D9M71_744670 [compost metagenome]
MTLSSVRIDVFVMECSIKCPRRPPGKGLKTGRRKDGGINGALDEYLGEMGEGDSLGRRALQVKNHSVQVVKPAAPEE